MAKQEELSFVVKRDIVQRLARFEGPTAIAKALKAESGGSLDLTPQRVAYYNPHTKAGAALAPDLKALFEETRKAFLEDVSKIGIANKAVQLAALDRALTLAETRGQIPMVIALVEAAADISGTITKKHELTGKNGAPLTPAAQVTIFQLPDNGRK